MLRAGFAAPPGVVVGEQWVSPDGCCAETPFIANAAQGAMGVAIAVDQKLQSLGYSRCDRATGDWDILRIRRSDGSVEQLIRLLRFYRIDGTRRMATVVAYENCEGENQACEQRYRVRLSDFPRTAGASERLIDAICSGEAFPAS